MNPERGHGGLASDPSALPIVVANAVDASFLPLVEVVATSIAASATSGRPVDYHVLYDGPDSPAAARLVGWRAGPVAIHLHRVVNPFTGLGRISGYPPSTLFRLAIEDVLADCGRVLYLDTDLLVRADLGELFDTPLDGAAIGAAPDIGAIENTLLRRPEAPDWRSGWYLYCRDVLGLDEAGMQRYVQTGVLLLDIRALREMRFAQRMADFLATHGDRLRFADQCALNVLFADRVALLDPAWNVLATGQDRHQRQFGTPPRILHFAGSKPWRTIDLPGTWVWWSCAWRAGRLRQFALDFLRFRASREVAALKRRLGTHQRGRT